MCGWIRVSAQASNRNPARLAGVVATATIWALLFLIAVLGPRAAPYDPTRTGVGMQFEAPSGTHLLGVDELGRDIWSRFLWGGQATLGGALIALVIAAGMGSSLSLGAMLGLVWIDSAIGYVINVLLTFPGLLVALIAVSLLGKGTLQIALAVGLSLAPPFARLMRGAIRGVMHQPFIGAVYALGAGRWWVLSRHVIRNVVPQMLGVAAVFLAWAMLDCAALEFLGLAGPPELATWGGMIGVGRAYLREASWEVLAPGFALVISALGLMLVGNLRRILGQLGD